MATTKKLLTWINLNPGGSRDEAGYWQSVEGRFEIAPNYRHTIYPDSYAVTDRLPRNPALGSPYASTTTAFDTIRDAKAWAEGRAQADLDKARASYGI